MPALMNTWRPKHDQENSDEYRQRVVEAGDGDVYRGMQIMHRVHAHQNTIIEHLLMNRADDHGVQTIHCAMCGYQEYLLGSASDTICYTCSYVREDTREWLNQKTSTPEEAHAL